MPLDKVCSLDAYKANVAELIKSGRDSKTAVAISIRTLKKACGVSSDERMSPKQIVGESQGYYQSVKGLATELKQFGSIYDDFDSVLDKFEEMNISLKPTENDLKIVAEVIKQGICNGEKKDIKQKWATFAKENCTTVGDCIRIYGIVLKNELPCSDHAFQDRAIELANRGFW